MAEKDWESPAAVRLAFRMKDMLSGLTDEETIVLIFLSRPTFGRHTPMTREEAAASLGITQTKLMNIEERGMAKLRRMFAVIDREILGKR